VATPTSRSSRGAQCTRFARWPAARGRHNATVSATPPAKRAAPSAAWRHGTAPAALAADAHAHDACHRRAVALTAGRAGAQPSPCAEPPARCSPSLRRAAQPAARVAPCVAWRRPRQRRAVHLRMRAPHRRAANDAPPPTSAPSPPPEPTPPRTPISRRPPPARSRHRQRRAAPKARRTARRSAPRHHIRALRHRAHPSRVATDAPRPSPTPESPPAMTPASRRAQHSCPPLLLRLTARHTRRKAPRFGATRTHTRCH